MSFWKFFVCTLIYGLILLGIEEAVYVQITGRDLQYFILAALGWAVFYIEYVIVAAVLLRLLKLFPISKKSAIYFSTFWILFMICWRMLPGQANFDRIWVMWSITTAQISFLPAVVAALIFRYSKKRKIG